MRKIIKKGIILAAAVMVAALLTGCGDSIIPLTENEESIVIQYSAGTLAKHNGFQQEGLTAVYPEEEEPKQDEEENQPEAEEEKEEQDNKPEKKEDKESDAQQEEELEQTEQITLTEAIGQPGVEFSYKDYSIVSGYSEGDYFSIDAPAGSVFLVLNINITNTGDQTAECNLLAKQPKFTLSLNQGAKIENEVTMLSNDVSTYVGNLEAGQTEAGILLFQVKEDMASQISSLQLSLEMGGKTNVIQIK